MRIALIGTRGIPAQYGGFETFAEEVSTRLAASGHDVTVYGRSSYYPAAQRSRRYKGVRTVYLRSLGVRQAETFSHTLLSALHILLRRKTDAVIVCNCTNGFFIPLLRLAGNKVLINVDGLEWQRDKWGRVSKALHRLAERATVLFGRPCIVVDSQAIGDYYRQRYAVKPRFIAYGAPVLVRPQKGPLPAVLQRLGLEMEGYILQITRFVPENNVLAIADAFHRSNLRQKLVLVGGDRGRSAYVESIRALAQRDARIVLPGFIYAAADVTALLTCAWAYAHGNEVGGTNPALLQAMGAGNAVLAIDTVFNREVLGEVGMFFGKNGQRLTAMLEQLAQQPITDMRERGRAAQAVVSAHYDWDNVAARYLEEFATL